MDKLELKHLSPYLPYELRLTAYSKPMNGRMCELLAKHNYSTIKPILRPLSEADVLIYNEFVKYNNNDPFDLEIINIFCFERIETESVSDIDLNNLQYEAFEWLTRNHFDVFGLIPAGLAISYKETGL